MTTAIERPSDLVILDRALTFAHEAFKAADVQLRRARTEEDASIGGIVQWWIDLQFFIVALRRLRRSAELAQRVQRGRVIKAAIERFDEALPKLELLRNVGEHIDDYSLDAGRDPSVRWRQLQVGGWDKTTFEWLGIELNADEAMAAAKKLVGWIEVARAEEMEAPADVLTAARKRLEG
jgi:hypothetical protein